MWSCYTVLYFIHYVPDHIHKFFSTTNDGCSFAPFPFFFCRAVPIRNHRQFLAQNRKAKWWKLVAGTNWNCREAKGRKKKKILDPGIWLFLLPTCEMALACRVATSIQPKHEFYSHLHLLEIVGVNSIIISSLVDQSVYPCLSVKKSTNLPSDEHCMY